MILVVGVEGGERVARRAYGATIDGHVEREHVFGVCGELGMQLPEHGEKKRVGSHVNTTRVGESQDWGGGRRMGNTSRRKDGFFFRANLRCDRNWIHSQQRECRIVIHRLCNGMDHRFRLSSTGQDIVGIVAAGIGGV
eukprot:717791-Prymnesium_polylepis.3